MYCAECESSYLHCTEDIDILDQIHTYILSSHNENGINMHVSLIINNLISIYGI